MMVRARAPDFNYVNAVYNAFDFSGPLELVKKAAGLPDRVDAKTG
jgi:4-hydroxyphenylacetate 3-monooxygenase